MRCYTAVIIPSLGRDTLAAYPNMEWECEHQILTLPYIYSSENNIPREPIDHTIRYPELKNSFKIAKIRKV